MSEINKQSIIHHEIDDRSSTFLISTGDDNTIKLWSIQLKICLITYIGHTESVSMVDSLMCGRRIISASRDNTLKLWDTFSGDCIRTYNGHEGGVISFALTKSGTQMVSSSWDKTLKLWNLKTGECIQTYYCTEVSSIIQMLPTRQILIQGYNLQVWSLDTGECVWTYTYAVCNLLFVCDKRYVYYTILDNIYVFDLKKYMEDKSYDTCCRAFYRAALNTSSGALLEEKKVMLLARNGCIEYCDIDSGKCIGELDCYFGVIEGLTVNEDLQQMVTWCIGHNMKLWDLESKELLGEFDHGDCVNSVCIIDIL
jgi:WD40 repeat protein